MREWKIIAILKTQHVWQCIVDEQNQYRPNLAATELNIPFLFLISCDRLGLCGLMTEENKDLFQKPVVVAYFNVDYQKNPKGTFSL